MKPKIYKERMEEEDSEIEVKMENLHPYELWVEKQYRKLNIETRKKV